MAMMKKLLIAFQVSEGVHHGRGAAYHKYVDRGQ